MLLKETVVDLAVALRGSLETEQSDLRLVGLCRLRYESS